MITTPPSASNFSRMEVAAKHIPRWYWNREVLLQLRQQVGRLLDLVPIDARHRVLELGCGNRAYEPVVVARGAEYLGADFADNAHADLHLDAGGTVACEARTFDVVLSIQVLEHVEDPCAHMAEIRRLLKPDGRAIISTHGIWTYHPAPQDYWRWTSSGLKKLLRDNGLRPVQFAGVIGMIPGAIQLIQDHLRRRLPGALQKPFTWTCQLLMRWLDRMHHEDNKALNAMIYIALVEAVELSS